MSNQGVQSNKVRAIPNNTFSKKTARDPPLSDTEESMLGGTPLKLNYCYVAAPAVLLGCEQ
jgi:hypothetical protein